MDISLYGKIGAETEAMNATPHRLIQLLFERAIQQIQLARHYMERKEIAKKCQAVTKAIDVIEHLRASLNFDDKNAKKISEKLSDVYKYIEAVLLKAHLKNDPILLDEALAKLNPIKTAWDNIASTVK